MSQYDANRDPAYVAPVTETAYVTPVEVRRESNNNAVGWLVAGVVAVVAIIAVAFMVMGNSNNTAPTAQDLQTAADNARTQGLVEGSNAALSSVQAGAQTAADQAAADTRAAAASARDAADRAASSARDATVAATPPPASTAPNDQAPQ